MLTDLQIKNFAIIDDLHITFEPGFSILSGETGAGKSIILGALNLVLGGRASADLIRTGEREAVVEALFDVSTQQSFQKLLAERGISLGESDTLLVKRIISKDNKNKVFINGDLSVLTVLVDIAEALLVIAGQREHQVLLRPQNHLDIVDNFGGLLPERLRYRQRFLAMQSMKKELETLKATAQHQAERRELLNYQCQEIENAGLTLGEDEELKKERKILQNASELIKSTHRIYEAVYGGDSALLAQISRLQKEFGALGSIDASLNEHVKTLDAVTIQLEDIAVSLRDYGQRLLFDPERLEEIENRLDLIYRLKKKYGTAIEEIMACHRAMLKELEEISQSSDRIAELETEHASARRETTALATSLSQHRKRSARKLCGQIEKELATLGMNDTKFDNHFSEVGAEALDEDGIDKMEFLFSPNPGEALRPLSRIASGGELSRVTLAFKHIYARQEGVATLIFDEVDAGIGGATAEVVGQKLHEISRYHQTICITHLPQIAAYGDTHYAVSKRVSGGRTTTEVRKLDQDERTHELARMLGGEHITQKTRTLANEMMSRAGQRKG